MCCRRPLALGNNVEEHHFYELISTWTSTSTPWPAGCLNYSDILRRTENWRDQNKQRSNLRANNDVILSFKSIFSTKYAGFVSLALIIQILASYTMFWSYPYPMPRSQSKYTEMEVTKIWRWGSNEASCSKLELIFYTSFNVCNYLVTWQCPSCFGSFQEWTRTAGKLCSEPKWGHVQSWTWCWNFGVSKRWIRV